MNQTEFFNKIALERQAADEGKHKSTRKRSRGTRHYAGEERLEELELGARVRIIQPGGSATEHTDGMLGTVISEANAMTKMSDYLRTIQVELDNGEKWHYARVGLERAEE